MYTVHKKSTLKIHLELQVEGRKKIYHAVTLVKRSESSYINFREIPEQGKSPGKKKYIMIKQSILRRHNNP